MGDPMGGAILLSSSPQERLWPRNTSPASGMKVALLTDPPNFMRHPRRQPPQFGGSYINISGVRRTLEQRDHGVHVLLALPDGTLTTEEDLYRFTLSKSLDLCSYGPGRAAASMVTAEPFDALIFALQRERLPEFLYAILGALKAQGRHPMILVSTGPTAGPFLSTVAAKYGMEITLLEKPGVARITRRSVDRILEMLDQAAAVSSS